MKASTENRLFIASLMIGFTALGSVVTYALDHDTKIQSQVSGTTSNSVPDWTIAPCSLPKPLPKYTIPNVCAYQDANGTWQLDMAPGN